MRMMFNNNRGGTPRGAGAHARAARRVRHERTAGRCSTRSPRRSAATSRAGSRSARRRRTSCPARAARRASVVFVGEAPGASEDRRAGRSSAARASSWTPARGGGARARGGLHHERRQGPPARQPRPEGRRGRPSPAVARRAARDHRAARHRAARPPRARPVRAGREDRRGARPLGRARGRTLCPMVPPGRRAVQPVLRETLARGRAGAARGAVRPVRIGCSGWQYPTGAAPVPEGRAAAPLAPALRAGLRHRRGELDLLPPGLARRRRAWGSRRRRASCSRSRAAATSTHMKRLRDLEQGLDPLLRAHRAARRHAESSAPCCGSCPRGSAATTRGSRPRSTRCRPAATRSSSATRAGSRGRLRAAARARRRAGDRRPPRATFQALELTADWTYVRFHDGRAGGAGTTRAPSSRVGAAGPRHGRRGAEVFAYFNNDWEGFAVRNARTLQALV